jgi:hypothetical protein
MATSSCGHTAPAAGNQSPLPFGSVDAPRPNAVLNGVTQVAGWALAEQPIEEIAVYVDRKYVVSADKALPRPDVAKAQPGFEAASKSGWLAMVDTNAFPQGWHELTVQARSAAGATRDLGTVLVSIRH